MIATDTPENNKMKRAKTVQRKIARNITDLEEEVWYAYSLHDSDASDGIETFLMLIDQDIGSLTLYKLNPPKLSRGRYFFSNVKRDDISENIICTV